MEENLLDAAEKGNIRKVKRLLLTEGLNVNVTSDDRGETPLHLAAKNGHANVVRLLLDVGAVVDEWCNSKCTALFKASREGHVEVMEVLLKSNADINRANDEGFSPLMIASFLNNVAATTLLLASGADKNQRDKSEHTPLMAAALEVSKNGRRKERGKSFV